MRGGAAAALRAKKQIARVKEIKEKANLKKIEVKTK